MLTKSDSLLPPPTKQKVANTFRVIGWLSFWVELAFAVGSAIVLLFSASGRNFATETTSGIGIGIFWAVCGLALLALGVFSAFRYTRIAKRLKHPNSDRHPSKADTIKVLQFGLIVGLIGILLCLFGAGATVGVLVAKAVSQPPGVAITDPNKIIRALDVFVVVANINGITAHFVGVVGSLGLLYWLHR